MLLVLWLVFLNLVIKFNFSTLNDTCSCLCLDFRKVSYLASITIVKVLYFVFRFFISCFQRQDGQAHF